MKVKLLLTAITLSCLAIDVLAQVSISGKIRVVCSKGTYIRALARDIGVALQSGAHLIALERTRIGDITLDKCMSPDDIDVFLDENITTEKDCED